jgi:hypothetical protein
LDYIDVGAANEKAIPESPDSRKIRSIQLNQVEVLPRTVAILRLAKKLRVKIVWLTHQIPKKKKKNEERKAVTRFRN